MQKIYLYTSRTYLPIQGENCLKYKFINQKILYITHVLYCIARLLIFLYKIIIYIFFIYLQIILIIYLQYSKNIQAKKNVIINVYKLELFDIIIPKTSMATPNAIKTEKSVHSILFIRVTSGPCSSCLSIARYVFIRYTPYITPTIGARTMIDGENATIVVAEAQWRYSCHVLS